MSNRSVIEGVEMSKVLSKLFALALAACLATSALAQSALIDHRSNATVNGTFDPQAITTSSLQFNYGTLLATGAGTFTFTYLGNESGWVNGFTLNVGGVGVLTEQNALGDSVTFQTDAIHLMPTFAFFTTDPVNKASASNGQTFSDSSNPSFAIIVNGLGGDVMASYGNARHGYQFVLGFNDAYVGDRDFDDYKVGVNFVAAPVPEPSTYALMLAGLTALGIAARRRRVTAING
jgi:PEP-CTERM motif